MFFQNSNNTWIHKFYGENALLLRRLVFTNLKGIDIQSNDENVTSFSHEISLLKTNKRCSVFSRHAHVKN